MPASLSSLRSQLLALARRSEILAQTFLDRDPLLPGCVYTLKRRCGKPHCRCCRGELHVTEMLSYRGKGRPQSVTPRPGELETYRELTRSYQRFRKARADWVKLHKQILQVVDSIEAARVEEGKAKFHSLLSERP